MTLKRIKRRHWQQRMLSCYVPFALNPLFFRRSRMLFVRISARRNYGRHGSKLMRFMQLMRLMWLMGFTSHCFHIAINVPNHINNTPTHTHKYDTELKATKEHMDVVSAAMCRSSRVAYKYPVRRGSTKRLTACSVALIRFLPSASLVIETFEMTPAQDPKQHLWGLWQL